MKNQDQHHMSDDTKLELVGKFMGAVKSGDKELMSSLLTDDGTWVFPGNNVLSGIAKGVEAVANKARLIVKYGVNIEHTNTLYSQHGLGLALHNQGKKDDLILDEFLHSAISFKQDKIDSIDTYLSDIPGMNAFFAGKPTGEFPENVFSDVVKYKIGEDFISALKSRDWNLMRSLLNEDVFWVFPGSNLLSGMAIGADAVITRANQLRDFGVTIEVTRLLIGLEGITLSLHNTATRGELVLDQQVAIVCKLTNGKISAIETFLDDVAAINSFFVENVI